jgi:hypothetical protein
LTLRVLLIQRAARLQDYPAVTAPPWGQLSYRAWRNRVEGVALGLMAEAPAAGAALGSLTGTAWDWACEVACAACGLRWQPGAGDPGPALGGPRFNDEGGRQAYHDREAEVLEDTPFAAGLDHGGMLLRLRRLNTRLGWDHTSQVRLPLADLATPDVRAALWSSLYAGGHAILVPGPVPEWSPEPFRSFWSE